MAVKQFGWFCRTCNAQRFFVKQRANHVLHLILTIVTLGLWSPVWITCAILASGKPARCQTCGRPRGADPKPVPQVLPPPAVPTPPGFTPPQPPRP